MRFLEIILTFLFITFVILALCVQCVCNETQL